MRISVARVFIFVEEILRGNLSSASAVKKLPRSPFLQLPCTRPAKPNWTTLLHNK